MNVSTVLIIYIELRSVRPYYRGRVSRSHVRVGGVSARAVRVGAVTGELAVVISGGHSSHTTSVVGDEVVIIEIELAIQLQSKENTLTTRHAAHHTQVSRYSHQFMAYGKFAVCRSYLVPRIR